MLQMASILLYLIDTNRIIIQNGEIEKERERG